MLRGNHLGQIPLKVVAAPHVSAVKRPGSSTLKSHAPVGRRGPDQSIQIRNTVMEPPRFPLRLIENGPEDPP